MQVHIISSEEYKGITTIFLSNKKEISFPTSRLVKYIEDNGLNIECQNYGTGLTCDPYSTDVLCEVEIDVEVYLDDNWDSVCQKYYTNVLTKED